jgi:hypothetical protein
MVAIFHCSARVLVTATRWTVPDGDVACRAAPQLSCHGSRWREVECEDGSVRRFTGWLGLVNELERLVADLA